MSIRLHIHFLLLRIIWILNKELHGKRGFVGSDALRGVSCCAVLFVPGCQPIACLCQYPYLADCTQYRHLPHCVTPTPPCVVSSRTSSRVVSRDEQNPATPDGRPEVRHTADLIQSHQSRLAQSTRSSLSHPQSPTQSG